MSEPLRIVVLGMMGRCPFGGQTWLYLNWLRGLRAARARGLVRRGRRRLALRPGRADADRRLRVRRRATSALRRGASGSATAGPSASATARRRPLLGLTAEPTRRRCTATATRCSTSSAPTDLRERAHGRAAARVRRRPTRSTAELRAGQRRRSTRATRSPAHDVIATYGENYGAPDCGVPLNGIAYRSTRQPIDLEPVAVRVRPGAPARSRRSATTARAGNDVECERRDLPLEQAPRVGAVPRPAQPHRRSSSSWRSHAPTTTTASASSATAGTS